MEENKANLNKKTTFIDIFPITKGKRILNYLADIFLCFIFTLVFFHLAVYPIGQRIIDIEEKEREYEENLHIRDDILFGHSLLFYKEEESKYATSENVLYTFDLYLENLVKGGHDDYEVFYHYFVDLSSSFSSYLDHYRRYDGERRYFDIQEDSVSLKEEYASLFLPFYSEKDTPTKAGEEAYAGFRDGVFAKMYAGMLEEIGEKDLVFAGFSYKQTQNRISELLKEEDYLVVISVFIAFVLGNIFAYLLLGLTTKNRKTISMMAMRLERIDKRKLNVWKRKDVLLNLPFVMISSAATLFFAPLPLLSFASLFSLPLLFPISLVALVYVIASIIYALFDPYNRILSDFFTSTIVISSDSLDEIYRSKGYMI